MARRRMLRAVVAVLATSLLLGGIGSASPASAAPVGQLLMASMPGRVPTAAFLARIRAGQIGGVVLFGDNFAAAGPTALDAQLQAAARAGGQPPLLIAIDQEGGIVKRLPGAPAVAPKVMGTATVARAQGVATAQNLSSRGINVDLAPVLDIGRGGFITSRTFGGAPPIVAALGTAFVQGLASGGVLATGKHFPGLGYAQTNTDNRPTIVTAASANLLTDLEPYTDAIAAGLPIVMVSTAVYPTLGVHVPAACSRVVVRGLLRSRLGFKGLVITDDLNTPGVGHYFTTSQAAVRAVGAGVDMVLVTGDSQSTYQALVAAAQSGQLSKSALAAAYARVLAVKQKLAH